ncbi:MAG: hypothetical protein DHS20C18_18290 [Saprospiraceae bacterium]|nr:MAG: hypothetical protein DHS20C18_18290 [Saprospiraceae bacterium]
MVSQPEVTAWGNLNGIRIDGQLMAFESSIRVVSANWDKVRKSAKERQRSYYSRKGNLQEVEIRLDSLFFTKTIEGGKVGTAIVKVAFECREDTSIVGAYYCLDLPSEDYLDGKVELIEPEAPVLSPAAASGKHEILRIVAKGARFISPRRQLEILANEATEIVIKADTSRGDTSLQIYLGIVDGPVIKGQTEQKTFTLTASGEIDRDPILLTLDPTQQGEVFQGIGGNFRIQNPRLDPQVIDYCLDNLRVAWGRVEMPWQYWHPVDSIDPNKAAETKGLHPRVQAAMEMAQRLHKMGMPVILSNWFGPDWAIIGKHKSGRGPDGQFGNPLNPDRMLEIYASITDYILYLKKHYGVEVVMFSFNESDLGIDIRQTDQEHLDLIKGLGAYMQSKGLKTKLVLGDTADANGYAFIDKAMDDPETYPYLGAVSFHSWRGCSNETLKKWAAAAKRLNLPLLVGEGSIDAAAWRYPQIFKEEIYAREEIELYTRMIAVCQPASILQWQLTSDYSALAGGGIYGEETPLYPTQRFWNLKQLGSTPENLAVMPLKSNKKDLTCAALGDNDEKSYAIHLVNNGPTREVTITGLPDQVKRMDVFVTDQKRSMEKQKRIRVKDGEVTFRLETLCFMTLMSKG